MKLLVSLGVLLVVSACAGNASPPPPTMYPPTPNMTPVPLLLTPIAPSAPLPALPPLVDSRASKSLLLVADTLITVNPDSDSVTLVDVGVARVTSEIPLGGSPRMVAAGDQQAVVTLWDANALAIIDLVDHSVRRVEQVCAMPFGVVTDARRAYVSCFGGDQIAVVDLETLDIL